MHLLLPNEDFTGPVLDGANRFVRGREYFAHLHHASDLGFCPRWRWCKYGHLKPSNPSTADVGLLRRWGTATEEVVIPMVLAAGLKASARQAETKCSQMVGDRPVTITGHQDFEITHPKYGLIGCELKGAGKGAYSHALKYGPKYHHLAQVHGYMATRNARRWLLIYFCRDMSGMFSDDHRGVLAYLCEWDGSIWQRVLDDLALLEAGVASKTPPDRASARDQTWQCQEAWCEFYDLCMVGAEALIGAIPKAPREGAFFSHETHNAWSNDRERERAKDIRKRYRQKLTRRKRDETPAERYERLAIKQSVREKVRLELAEMGFGDKLGPRERAALIEKLQQQSGLTGSSEAPASVPAPEGAVSTDPAGPDESERRGSAVDLSGAEGGAATLPPATGE